MPEDCTTSYGKAIENRCAVGRGLRGFGSQQSISDEERSETASDEDAGARSQTRMCFLRLPPKRVLRLRGTKREWSEPVRKVACRFERSARKFPSPRWCWAVARSSRRANRCART